MLATVGRYFDPWEAHILRARLVAEGIPATVAGDQHMMANWPMSVALGGAALQVPVEFLEQAQELVAAYHSGVLEQELIAADPGVQDRCPSCLGKDFVASIPVGQRALNVATTLLFSIPFSSAASRIECRSCGHHWHYGA